MKNLLFALAVCMSATQLSAQVTTLGVLDDPSITDIRILEVTGPAATTTFTRTDPRLSQRLPVLNNDNKDFEGVAFAEFYDVYASDPDGTVNEHGACLSFEGVYRGGTGSLGGQGFNIADVAYRQGGTWHSFEAVGTVREGDNPGPYDPLWGIDGDPTTFIRLGDTNSGRNTMLYTVCRSDYHVEFPNCAGHEVTVPSKFGPQTIPEFCADEKFVSFELHNKTNADNYYVTLEHFDMQNWQAVTVHHDGWVCSGPCSVPSVIAAEDFLTPGQSFIPGAIYHMQIAVGPTWMTEHKFFQIGAIDQGRCAAVANGGGAGSN